MSSSRKPIKSTSKQPNIQNTTNGNTNNAPPRKKKSKIRLRIQKNPYGKIIDEEKTPWPPRDDIECALKRGPTAIANWQSSQIEELIVPHLNGKQIHKIIQKLGFPPSVLFKKICEKLLIEFENNTLNSLNTNNNSDSELNRDKLLNILKHSLRFIRIKQFKQFNIEILSRIDIIPKPVLRILSDNKNQDLLKEFPINIKRQIWTHKLVLFDREFDGIFYKYVSSNCNDDNSPYFHIIYKFKSINDNLYIELTKIKRANNDTLKEIVNDIGSEKVLFDRCSDMMEKQYLNILRDTDKTRNWENLISLSNFRIDISCSLFDHAHQHLIDENDKIWKLIRMIFYGEDVVADLSVHTNSNNRCNRKEKNVLNMNELDLFHKYLFDKGTTIQTSILLHIPYVKSLLFNTFVFLLEDIANKQILPRDSKSLSLLCSILQISSQPFLWFKSAKKSINGSNGHATNLLGQIDRNLLDLKIPKPDHKVLFEFTPLLTSCIYIDSLGIDLNELDDEDKDIGTFNDKIIKWCKDNIMCLYVLLYYILFLLHRKYINRFMEIIKLSLKIGLDNCYLLTKNGVTEINLICQSVLKLIPNKNNNNQSGSDNDNEFNDNNDNHNGTNQVKIKYFNMKQKCKIIEFLIMFIDQTQHEKEITDPIINLINNIGLHGGDKNRYLQNFQQ